MDQFSSLIVGETSRWICLAKPAHLSVHNAEGDDLLSLLQKHCGKSCNVAPIHRLDVGTSGLILFGKDKAAITALGQMIAASQIKKCYLALCRGHFGEKKAIDSPLAYPLTPKAEGRDHPQGPRALRVEARTHFQVKAIYERCSLLLLTLETGRKHQIRRHLALSHHPILGDERYGPKSKHGTPAERLALHALQLTFDDPFDHVAIKLQIPPPDDFWQVGGIVPVNCENFC